MPAKKSQHKPLPAQELANIYLQLALLEDSGIPTLNAMTMLVKGGGESSRRATMALNYLKRGKPLSEAGVRAGLFVGLDVALVKVAEASGTNAEVFRQMAQFYEEKARQRRQIKSRLFLPVTVLLLAVFIQPVPALILEKITILDYLGTTVGFIVQLALLVFVLMRLPRWLRHGFLRPFGGLWDKIEMNTPYFGRWYVRQSLRDFMRALGLMLQAGLPILEALPKGYEVVENTILRRRLQKISTRLHKGDTFAEAFSLVPRIDPVAAQLILTGEHAGSLADMLLHYVKFESEAITMHNDMLAAWIPRLVYASVAAMMIYSLILSVGSLMPPEL